MTSRKAKKVIWNVIVGATTHSFSTKKAARAFAQWMLGNDTLVWKSVSE